jgi:hypothetical protein
MREKSGAEMRERTSTDERDKESTEMIKINVVRRLIYLTPFGCLL